MSPCKLPCEWILSFPSGFIIPLLFLVRKRDGLVGVIDIDNDTETLVGDDIDIDDIVWYGSVDSVKDMADAVGVANTVNMKGLKTICNNALREHREVHFLPPYRADIKIQIFDLFGIHPNQQKESASMETYPCGC